MKSEKEQLLDILRKINCNPVKTRPQKKKKPAETSQGQKKSKSKSKSPPSKQRPNEPPITVQNLDQGQSSEPQSGPDSKRRMMEKYREEKWAVPQQAAAPTGHQALFSGDKVY